MDFSVCSELRVETCHKIIHDKQVGLISVVQLDAMDGKLIAYRIGIDEDKMKKICYHHKEALLTRYEYFEKRCCNPFKNHKKTIKGDLRPISVEMAYEAKAKLALIPGQKLCPLCRRKVRELFSNDEELQFETMCVSDEDM